MADPTQPNSPREGSREDANETPGEDRVSDVAQLRAERDLFAKASEAAELRIVELRAEVERLRATAEDFVEHREEATDSIWYCDGEKGLALLKVLGIEYVSKE